MLHAVHAGSGERERPPAPWPRTAKRRSFEVIQRSNMSYMSK
jgi:hypothetical protein